MSRRPAPSIFDADSMSVEDLKSRTTAPEAEPVAEPNRASQGRPTGTDEPEAQADAVLHPPGGQGGLAHNRLPRAAQRARLVRRGPGARPEVP